MPMNQAMIQAFLRRAQEPGRVVTTGTSLRERLTVRDAHWFVTINLFELHHYVHSPAHRALLDSADGWTADGWPIVKALRTVGIDADRVTGSGLCTELLTAPAGSGLRRIAVLGSDDAVVSAYAQRLLQQERAVVFQHTGRRDDWTESNVGDGLRSSRPDLVLVAVGTPYGVAVASRLQTFMPCPVIAVGAGVGLAVGMERRAPAHVQQLYLEWAWRMAADPRRLARRYVVDCAPLVPALWRAAKSVAAS